VSVLPIFTSDSAIVHQRAQPIDSVTDEIRQLAENMVETMAAAPGVGLAAPQVGQALRLFVWSYHGADAPSDGVIVNPRLRLRGPWRHRFWGEPDEEGCLSLPGLRYPLARAERVLLEGHDLDGRSVQVQAEGWLARIFQHEFDHLDGVLYRDRLRRRWRRAADHEWRTLHPEALPQWIPGLDGEESDFVDS